MKGSVIVALDVETFDRAQKLVKELSGVIRFFKVGSELFTSCGPPIVDMIRKRGGEVFLDLKFHDIPNTVASAVRTAASLNVFMCNVHAQGGRRMMEEAVRVRDASRASMRLLAVTVLTSMNEGDLKEIGVSERLPDHVLRLAGLAKESGLDGVVCAGTDIRSVRELGGEDFMIVTPGVRPSWAAPQDQKRVIAPKEALGNGADFVVIGRPIIQAEKPLEAARKVLMEIGDQ